MIVCPCCGIAIAFAPNVLFCDDCSSACAGSSCRKRECTTLLRTERPRTDEFWAVVV